MIKAMAVSALLTAIALSIGACAKHAADEEPPPGEPVAECVAYEHLLASCMHRKTDFAAQAILKPSSPDERAKVRTVCSDNLRRLQAACR
jgi:hypothetical protein